jgi:NADH pyrophosphatase NudC (nudix superfamily)
MRTNNRYCSQCLQTRTFVKRGDIELCPYCRKVLRGK